ncbi:MAG: [Fe-Fe] hydrogenase large subunit C-terminal domain-containing protein [Candidatus Gastranaerophilales bacterium]|nr:[Fe-Fe] hydrogenase large subunit C-terminal domain-containing protein [Candidatus Gastranaerophilales bacterium]
MSIIKTNPEKCTACNKCIAVCPVKYANSVSIDKKNKRVITVDNDKCISCGDCLKACDHHAREYVDDIDTFLHDLSLGKKINVMVAPSFVAIKYKEYKKFFGYLKSLGVNFIYDVSFGADITSWGYAKFIEKQDDSQYWISQPCPVVVDFIEKYEPKLIKNLIPVNSPVACSAIYIKKYLKNTDSLALISPCIAKRKEMLKLGNKGLFEYSITINKFFDYIKEQNIDLSQFEEVNFDETEGFLGKFFSRSGGLKDNVKYHCPDMTIRHIEGSSIIYDYLRYSAENPDEEKPYKLLDILNCSDGCNIGSMVNFDSYHSSIIHEYQKELIVEQRHANQDKFVVDYDKFAAMVKQFDEILNLDDFLISYDDKSALVNIHNPNENDIAEAFLQIRKKTKDSQEINCKSCGYPTCKDFAIAIHNKLNVPSSCYRFNQQVIKDQEKYMRTILENISECVILTNSRKVIEYVNKDAKNILGYDLETYIGKPFIDFLVRRNLKPLVNGATIEYKAIHRSGTYRDLKVTCRTIYINDKMKYLLVLEDITKERELEVIKQNFVSIISHELRTPLTSIRGAIGLISSGMVGELPQKAKELVKIAGNNAVRLVNLINDMLDLEKMKAGKMDFVMDEFDVKALVEEAVVSNMAYALQNNVKFVMDKTLEDTKINVDSGKFIQIITNLLSNAAKYSTSGENVIINIIRENNLISVVVTNKGDGIPKSVGNKIFDSFYQITNKTNNQKKGTGLGLNICKFMTEQMGGLITYDSEVGEYTSFKVSFPEIYNIENPPIVLVCEDNQTTANLIKKKFEELDYKVEITHSANDAFERLKTQKYDLMSLDLMLPDKDGLEFLDEIKACEKTKNIPVIIVSASKRDPKIVAKYKVVEWYEKAVEDNYLKDIVYRLLRTKEASTPKILHVEDDKDLATVVASMLSKSAMVTTISTIQEAKQILLRDAFDLIILDYKLSDGTSEELVDIIKSGELNKDAFIIIFSGYDIDKKLAEKVDSVILKTQITQDKFVDTIKKIVKKPGGGTDGNS